MFKKPSGSWFVSDPSCSASLDQPMPSMLQFGPADTSYHVPNQNYHLWSFFFLDLSPFLPIFPFFPGFPKLLLARLGCRRGGVCLRGRENSPPLKKLQARLKHWLVLKLLPWWQVALLISAKWCITCSIPELHCRCDNRQEVRYCHPSYVIWRHSFALENLS